MLPTPRLPVPRRRRPAPRGRRFRWAAAPLGILLAAACSSSPSAISTAPTTPPATLPPPAMAVTSTAFTNGTAIPPRYTCYGVGVSPPLDVGGIPAGTKSLALIVDDPDAPDGDYAHWLLFDIPPSSTHLSEGTIPAGTRVGTGTGGMRAYDPPCPPNGTHNYRFSVYALNSVFTLPTGADAHEVSSAVQQAVTAWGMLTGTVTAAPTAGASSS